MSNTPTSPLKAAPSEIIVSVRPEAELNIAPTGLSANTNFDLTNLAELITSPERSLQPLFGLSERRLRFRKRLTEEALGVEAPDLSVLYRLRAPEEQIKEVIGRLREEPFVETVYRKPGVVPAIWRTDMTPDLTPLDLTAAAFPNFIETQRYLNPAPFGIDARFAWDQPGGRGASIGIIDIEGAWQFSHRDLGQNQGGVIGGIATENLDWRNHGTAVIGIFSGDDNESGVIGICPDANVRAVSVFGNESGWGVAAAILRAADKLNPGDILLIELQAPGPAVNFEENDNQRGYIPIEWWPDNLKAIRYATQRGVLVVNAGGNGAENLDSDIYDVSPEGEFGPFPADWRNPFKRNLNDSQSIFVGAGAPPEGQGFPDPPVPPDRCRINFSNFGEIFDAQGWGELVTTCGFGNTPAGGGPDEDFWFTTDFSGTSSAAPMIAGALGCVQGILKKEGLPPLTPLEARDLLRTTGSEQGDDPSSPIGKRIGNRPDLKEMIAKARNQG